MGDSAQSLGSANLIWCIACSQSLGHPVQHPGVLLWKMFTSLHKGLVWWVDHHRLADDSFENVGQDGQRQFWFASRERNGPDGREYKEHTERRKAMLPDLI